MEKHRKRGLKEPVLGIISQAFPQTNPNNSISWRILQGGLNISREGHRVKNPGGLEGWNKLQLGTALNNLSPGASDTVVQDLSIKAVDDAEFEIHYSADNGRDFVQLFSNRDTRDKNAVLKLTNN